MRGMVVEAEWAPRAEYHVEPQDSEARLARNGNKVWRNPQFRIMDLARPSIGPDGMLIRVRACGICGSDVHMFERDADGYMLYPGMIRTPVVTGHEFSGTVEAVGEESRLSDPATRCARRKSPGAEAATRAAPGSRITACG